MKTGNQYTNPREYTETHARCSMCHQLKLFSEFHNDSKMKVASRCRKCALDENRAYRLRHASTPEYKEARNNTGRKWKHGLTSQEYVLKLADQNFECAICGTHMWPMGKSVHLDHDHKTGKLRKFLCHFCNIALGCFRDDIKNLEAAIVYLEEHQE